MNYLFKANLAHKAVFVSYLLQIFLLVGMTLIWVPEGKTANLTVCIILLTPLLPFFPFLLKRSLHAHVWLCFLSLLYFMLAVPSAFDPRYGWIGHAELANIMFLFIATMCFTRWEQRQLGISITR